jgi:tetratricopeptide (TPR) repeat protein
LQGGIAHAEGNTDDAIVHLQAAAEFELATPKPPVTPAPTLPANEQLGYVLMESGRYADALAAFERSLELAPKRFLSISGAARAAEAAGDAETARAYYRALLAVADPSSDRAVLGEAREYLQESR